MKIELRWVAVLMTTLFGATLSTTGLILSYPNPLWYLWLLAYIPYIVSISFTIGVELTKRKNEK